MVAMDIELLRNVFQVSGNVEYTAHCQKRMLERDISREDIKYCIMNGEVIEDYPLMDGNVSPMSLPSCLILGMRVKDKSLIHVVVGFNGQRVLIISAYYPELEHWENDYRTRKGGGQNV